MPEAQQPAPQPQATSTAPKSHDWKKVGLTVLIILVVSGLLVATYWFLVLNKSSEDSDLTGPVPKVTTKPSTDSAKEDTPSAEKDETADWKTYSNQSYGFSIKYPNSWDYIDQTKFETQNCDPGPTVGKGLVLFGKENLKCVGVGHFGLWDEKVEFVVYATTRYNPLKPITEEIYTDLTINGEKAVKNFLTETSQGPRCTCTRIYVNHKDKGFMIEFVNKDLKGNYDPIYDTIPSTFKFID